MITVDLGRNGSFGLLDKAGSCGFLTTRELEAVAPGNLEAAASLGELEGGFFSGDLDAEAVVS